MPEQIPEEKRFIMKRSIRKTLSVLAAIAIVTNGFGMLSQSYGIFSDSPVSVSAVTMLRQPCCTGITDQSAIQIFCDEQNYNSLYYRIINENEKLRNQNNNNNIINNSNQNKITFDYL